MPTIIMIDYYNRPFQLLHEENARNYNELIAPNQIRTRFWQLIPFGKYSTEESRVYLNSYLKAAENELSNSISELSLAYCLHIYRRLSPGPIGQDKQPLTIGLTRAILEASIQKYSKFKYCDKIAESNTVPIEKVLGGLLMSPEFNNERDSISRENQLVLTNFSNIDLLAFYDLERLAYEIWRASAALRTIGKGTSLIVCNPPECFKDGRSIELDLLLEYYDSRIGKSGWSNSSKGVVFNDAWDKTTDGIILLPIYNLGGITSDYFKDFFRKLYNITLLSPIEFNFVWIPFNLREYYKAHLPFSLAFSRKYNVSLEII